MNDKKQSSIICYSFLTSCLSSVIVCYLLSFFPDKLDTEMITSTFVHSLGNFTAETSEKLQYVLGVVVFLVTYYFTGKILNNKVEKISNTEIEQGITIFSFFALAAFVFSKERLFIDSLPQTVKSSFFAIFFSVVVFIIIYNLFFKERKFTFSGNALTVSNVFLCIAGIASVIIVSSFFFRETYFYGNSTVEHHTDAYFYPIWKLWSGQYPLVDFTSLYGYYPYFFVGILSLFGGVSIKGFSVIISFLVFITFTCIFFVLWTVCRKKIFALLGLLSVEYILIMYNSELSEPYYLQYLPHRMISLCVILAVSCAYVSYFRKHGKPSRLIEITGWICAGLSLLWNLDTGLFAWLGWAVFLCYMHLIFSNLFKVKTWLYILRTVAVLLVVAFLSFSSLLLITYILSGQKIGFGELFWGQGVFYSSGFFMLKMKLYHPWMIIMFIYAAAFAVAFSKIKDHRTADKIYNLTSGAMYFMTALVGVGAFLYFQGRSHNLVFIIIVWPAVMLLSMFLDRGFACRKIIRMQGTKNIYTAGFAVLLSVLLMFSYGWIYSIASPTQIFSYKNKTNTGISNVQLEINVIDSEKLSPENTELLTSFAAETYEHYGVRYMPRVQAEVDIFSFEHVNEILELLRTTSKDVLISSKTKGYLTMRNSEEFETILSEKYNVKQVDNFLVLRQKTNDGGK